MRIITAYSFFVIYITLLILPCLPLLKDTIAHRYFKKEHLLTVHQKHGHHHVHSEMAARSEGAAEESESQNSENLDFFLQLIPENFYFNPIKNTVVTFCTATVFIPGGFTACLLQPPD